MLVAVGLVEVKRYSNSKKSKQIHTNSSPTIEATDFTMVGIQFGHLNMAADKFDAFDVLDASDKCDELSNDVRGEWH